MKKIMPILIILAFLAAPLAAIENGAQPTFNTKSTTNISTKVEFLDVYLGKRTASVITYSYIGGNVEFPFAFNETEFQNLVALKLSVGVGYRWWLWYHRDIWPDIPPALVLTLVYREGASTAVPKAKSLAQKISDIYGIELQPFNMEEIGDYTVVRFARAVTSSEVSTFVSNNILSLIPDTGLGKVKNSPKITDDIQNGKYSRAFYALVQDKGDIDQDNITNEYVPVIATAFVANETIQRLGNRTFDISLDRAIGMDLEYDAPTGYNISVARFHFLFPIEVIEENSTLPDNPLYEYSGVLAYDLKRGNYTRSDLPLDDIKIVFKPFSAQEELASMPKVFTKFYISKVNTSYKMNGENATKIDFSLEIENKGGSTALDLEAYFFLPRSLMYMLYKLHREGYKVNETLISDDWTVHVNASYREYRGIILTSEIGDLAVNETKNITFSVVVPNRFAWSLKFVPIEIQFGPIVYYKDVEGKFYLAISNGIFVWVNKAVVGARLTVTNTELYTDKTLTVTANVTVANFGPDDIINVKVDLVKGITTEMNEMLDFSIIASSTIASIPGGTAKSVILQSNQNLRPGFWTVFGIVSFNVGGKRFRVSTNGRGVLVLPPKSLYDKWVRKLRYPIPHVELDIYKNVSRTGDTLEVEIYIRNTGDLDTTLNIMDWWNLKYVDTSRGFNGVLEFSVNGSAKDFDVYVNPLLGTVKIVSRATTVPVNTTVVIKYKLALNATVNTSDIVSNPTLVRYLYGTIPPEKMERPDEIESNTTETLGAGTLGSEAYKLYAATVKPLDGGQSTYLDAYTNAVIQVNEIVGGGEAPSGNILRVAILGIVAIVIIAGVLLVLRRRS
ncbi:MAG: hypothetical protein ACP6IP_06580 [Candidatus Njordarchaeia archaeon]